jgi:hypothetical protein
MNKVTFVLVAVGWGFYDMPQNLPDETLARRNPYLTGVSHVSWLPKPELAHLLLSPPKLH